MQYNQRSKRNNIIHFLYISLPSFMPVSFNKNSNALGQEIRTIPSYVADALIKDVVKGELPPGSRLKEIDLAQRFGVSRTVIREAIAILERDGYAERKIGRASCRERVSSSGLEASLERKET